MTKRKYTVFGWIVWQIASRLAKALHIELGSVIKLTRMDAEGAPERVASQLDRLLKAPSLDAVVRHEGVATPHTTPYLLLRHALLVEYAGAAARALNIPPAQRVEEDQLLGPIANLGIEV